MLKNENDFQVLGKQVRFMGDYFGYSLSPSFQSGMLVACTALPASVASFQSLALQLPREQTAKAAAEHEQIMPCTLLKSEGKSLIIAPVRVFDGPAVAALR